MKLLKLALALILFAAPVFAQHTYYVSSSTGSDSNTATQAQSKTTPWAHLPGMPAATGVASTYSAVAGDQFVLKGCDVWYNTAGKSSFPLALNHGGASGNPVKIGVDQTWFNPTCSVWNRPVFDAHTSSSSNVPTQIGGTLTGCVGNGGNSFMSISGSNITVDFVEFRNLYYSNNAENSCYGGNSIFQVNSGDNITVSNPYIHGWRMGQYVANSVNDTDTLIFTSACPHCLLTKAVSDNCDATGVNGPFPGGAMNMVNVTFSVFKCMSNAYKPTIGGEFGWNEITLIGESPDTTIHSNCIETLGNGGTGIYYIHDNRIHDIYSCEEGQVGNPSETDYLWNNVYWNQIDVGSNTPQVPQNETPVSIFFFNNVVVDGGGCIHDASHGYTWSATFESQNNLCISGTGSNSSGSPTAKTVTISNNLGLSNSTATADGYTNSQQFVFSPTKSSNPTVNAGVNLTALMPAGFVAQDSSIFCTEQTINTVVQVVCTGTPKPRPASGAWDIGAYQFTQTGQPRPPTGLTAVPQ